MENNKKWYNIELLEKDSLRKFLKNEGIKFEISGVGKLYHFEILLDSIGFRKVNNFLTE